MTKCKVIALANQKGGTAKTTTTIKSGNRSCTSGAKSIIGRC